MLGRTPGHISAVRPLIDGVVSDFEVAQEMLSYFIRRVIKNKHSIFVQADDCHRRAFRYNQCGSEGCPGRSQKFRRGGKFYRDEPMAAAIGVRLPVHEPVGKMIVDIGGGTTDIAVISLNGIVSAKNMRIVGD